MLKYIGKRLIMLIPVILVTSFLIFWAMSLTGGDPALMLAGDNAKPEQIEQIREDLGLNDPFIVRYGNYMKGMLTGDMGKSYVDQAGCIQDLHGASSEYPAAGRSRRAHRCSGIPAARYLHCDTSKYMEGYSGYDICPVRHVHAKLLVGTHADHHIFTEAGSVSNGR